MDEVKNYPPYLDYPKSYTASADEHKHKIKTSFARIIVEGTPAKPYYNIEYFDPTDKEYHIGFGSYYLDNVFNWFAEEFEITESHTDTDTDYISRAALLARYDAEHVGSPGRARELIVTAPAADVVEVVRCENCVHYHPCQVELTDGSAPDWGICDQPWFNDDQNDVDEMFYCAQGERRGDGTSEIHRDNVAGDAL